MPLGWCVFFGVGSLVFVPNIFISDDPVLRVLSATAVVFYAGRSAFGFRERYRAKREQDVIE